MGNSGVIIRSLRIVWKSSPTWAAASGVSVVLNALLPLVMLWAMGRMVDATLASVSAAADGVDVMALMPSLAAFGVALFASYAMSALSDWCTSELGEKLKGRVADMIHSQMSKVDYQTMQSPQFQTEAFRAISGSTQMPVNIFFSTINLVESSLTFCAMSIWLTQVKWWLPLVVMAAGAPVVAVRMWDTRAAYGLYKRLSADERRMRYYNNVLTQPRYAPEVRLFGLTDLFRDLYADIHRRTAGERTGLKRRSMIRQVLASGLSTLAVMTVFVVVIVMAVGEGLSVGSLAMYLMAIRRAETAVGSMSRRSITLHSQGLYVRSLFEFLDLRASRSRKAPFPANFKRIEVRDVSFSYPGSGRRALRGMSFTIGRGEVVGIRGGNGTGKSTIVKMLCGLLRPDSGIVAIDGTAVSDISPEELSRNVCAVFQDFRVYCATAKENIHFGDIRTGAETGKIRAAASAADIDNLISSLPNGYDTELGNEFPGSEMFSRGEWQRLAQARIYFSRAEIVIFDEAASALDPRARLTMQKNIAKLRSEGRTVIIVSHLCETLDAADRIIDLG